MALYPNTTTLYPAELFLPPKRPTGNNPTCLVLLFDGDLDENGNVPQLAVPTVYVFRTLQQLLG